MRNEDRKTSVAIVNWLVRIGLDLPWLEILIAGWKVVKKVWRGLAEEGMYEVLEHESTLELLDKEGTHAAFRKREKIRYLQNNILAYQDHAWGDGKILLNYRCTPGVLVDRYRPGNRTYLLISLRENKQHGEMDEFHIEWEIKNGFLRTNELWETEVRHRTKKVSLHILFPEPRPPLRAWIIEDIRRRKHTLTDENIIRLPDGRTRVSWQTNHPRLYERYMLAWEW